MLDSVGGWWSDYVVYFTNNKFFSLLCRMDSVEIVKIAENNIKEVDCKQCQNSVRVEVVVDSIMIMLKQNQIVDSVRMSSWLWIGEWVRVGCLDGWY